MSVSCGLFMSLTETFEIADSKGDCAIILWLHSKILLLSVGSV